MGTLVLPDEVETQGLAHRLLGSLAVFVKIFNIYFFNPAIRNLSQFLEIFQAEIHKCAMIDVQGCAGQQFVIAKKLKQLVCSSAMMWLNKFGTFIP